MKQHRFLCIIFFIGLLGIFSCADESDCFSENLAEITIEFYSVNTLDPDTSFYETDTLIFSSKSSVYVVGNRDSLILKEDNDTIFGKISFPVDPRIDTTAYVIGNHSLIISYDIRQRVLSADCGVEQVYSNLDTISTTYDSLVIDNRNLDINEVNFKVYSF